MRASASFISITSFVGFVIRRACFVICPRDMRSENAKTPRSRENTTRGDAERKRQRDTRPRGRSLARVRYLRLCYWDWAISHRTALRPWSTPRAASQGSTSRLRAPFFVSPEDLGTVVPKLNRGKMPKAYWRTCSDQQAFLGMTNHTELDLRGGKSLSSCSLS